MGFLSSALKQLLRKISETNFNRNFDSFRNYISPAILLGEGFLEGALQSELVIPPFVERFKAAILSKS